MPLREQDKHFVSSLYAAVAIIFAWKGMWEGIYEIPYVSDYLGDPLVFLFLGLAMLTLSGLIFKEFDPLGSIQKGESKVLHTVFRHPQKKEFTLKYEDKVKKQEVEISVSSIKALEKGSLIVVFPNKRQEVFIPFHRVTEILRLGKQYWRL